MATINREKLSIFTTTATTTATTQIKCEVDIEEEIYDYDAYDNFDDDNDDYKVDENDLQDTNLHLPENNKKLNPPKKQKIDKKLKTNTEPDAIDAEIKLCMQLKCDVCENNFETFSEVRQHYRDQHNQAGYIMCCGRKFDRRSRLHTHLGKHNNSIIKNLE